jgi:hypothetical protein
MKNTSVKLSKQFKIGLPNYSNLTVGIEMEWDIAEGEQFDFDKGFDVINQQLNNQADTDPSWIKTKEHKNHFTATIKQQKLTEGGK